MLSGTMPVNAGSSPLTRGKLAPAGADSAKVGLIPAHAGKTLSRRCFRKCRRAHPRSRGENLVRRVCRRRVRGSSPLTRGKRIRPHQGKEAWRLIPAHAGKTRCGSVLAGWCGAHPRSRGENSRWSSLRRARYGSSPLTRGKLGVGDVGDGGHGLIPAHAGKTRRASCRLATHWAHPRSRGENSVML